MDLLRRLSLFAYDNFASLLVFIVAKHFLSLKAAILATLLISFLDLGFRTYKKLTITRLYIFSLVVTICFGAVDVYVTTPFLLKYESVVTNLLTASFFGITLFRGKPLIQEIAEKTLSQEKKNRPDVNQYLRFLTFLWTGYFVLKALLYAYVSYRYSFEQAMAFRSAFGATSVVILLFGEKVLRPYLVRILRTVGLMLPAPQPLQA